VLKNVKIKTRIILALGTLTGLLLLLGVLGLVSIEETTAKLTSVAENDIKHSGTVNDIRFKMESNRSQILQALQHNPVMEWHRLHDHQLAIHAKLIADTSAALNHDWAQYLGSIQSPEERTLANAWYAESKRLGMDQVNAAIQAISAEQWDAAEEILIKGVNPTYRQSDVALKALTDLLGKREREHVAAVSKAISQIKMAALAVLIFSVVAACVIGVSLVRSIMIPLGRSVEIAKRVAQGDLTGDIEVASKNEIGELMEALRSMNAGLASIVHEVQSSAALIGTASKEIASGNMDLSGRTEQQASSLEETSSSMEQLTATVQQNGERAQHANELAHSASDVAMRGGTTVSQVVQTMGAINESAKKIFDIISVIDGIAFQTNILALNAAVEAARAGEHGRGFAVVASEVRNLAQRSASAAREIKSLIGESMQNVEAGARLVDQAGATMDEIVASAKRVTDIMQEITSASMEQSVGISQVNQAVSQMDQMTQQNAALVEQAAAASASLETQAQHLAQAVSVFRVRQLEHTATGNRLTVVPNLSTDLSNESFQPARLAASKRVRAVDYRSS
jgi:methyl-accepting chemotaxis protein